MVIMTACFQECPGFKSWLGRVLFILNKQEIFFVFFKVQFYKQSVTPFLCPSIVHFFVATADNVAHILALYKTF